MPIRKLNRRTLVQQLGTKGFIKTGGPYVLGHIPWNKDLPKEQQPMFGKQQSQHQKETMKSKHTGYKRTAESIKKQKATRKVNKKPAWNLGLTKETDERVAKYAKSLLGVPLDDARKAKTKEYQNLPSTKKAKSKRHTGKIVRKETKEKLSIIGSSQWLDPVYIAKQRKSRNQAPEWPEVKPSVKYKYSKNFSKPIKRKIFKRDEGKCQSPYCKVKAVLNFDIHHIDYNKQNTSENNLILLCDSCHAKTNQKDDRYFWKIMFQHMIKYGNNPNADISDPDVVPDGNLWNLLEEDIDREYGRNRRLRCPRIKEFKNEE